VVGDTAIGDRARGRGPYGEFDGRGSPHLSVTGNITLDLSEITGGSSRSSLAGRGYRRPKTLVGRGPGVPGLAPFTSGEGTDIGRHRRRVAINQTTCPFRDGLHIALVQEGNRP
jgi:hypothetical protein